MRTILAYLWDRDISVRISGFTCPHLAVLVGFWMLFTHDCSSKEKQVGFEQFDFRKVGVPPEKLKMLYHSITGSTVGADILDSCGRAALIEFYNAGITTSSGFSFEFDEKIVKRHIVIERQKAVELCNYLRLGEVYGYNRYEHVDSDAYKKAFSNPIGMELSDGTRFLRVYFDAKFSHCFYVSCTGEYGGTYALAPKVTERIKVLVEDFKRISQTSCGDSAHGKASPPTKKQTRANK